MPRRLPNLLTALAVCFGAPAFATVEGFIKVNVPYYEPQTGDICLMRQTILTEFGIPQASMMGGTLAPTQLYRDYPTPHYVNVNLIATQPPMVGSYVRDGFSPEDVWEYGMKLDITALASANGNSLEGRTATVKAAKLFLIAMAQNMADISRNNFRLSVEIVGLPSQVGLPGARIYATTNSPFSANSALLATLRGELINTDGHCRQPPL